MVSFKEFILESNIKSLEKKLKETSDADMRDMIQKQITAAKLSKK